MSFPERLLPHQLTFLTTSKCTARCAHCSVNSGPERDEKLTFAKMRETIDDVARLGSLKLVIFAGGEPTLLGQHLLDTIAHCDAKGLVTRLVTNASWARSPAAAERKIESLRNAGLAELNLSADDYHLPYIPFAWVRNAWMAAHGRGFSAVVVANCYGPMSQVTPDYIKRELGAPNLQEAYDDDGFKRALVNRSQDGTMYGLSNAFLQNIGRSREEVAPEAYFRPRSEEIFEGGCPWAIRSAAVSPKNHLVACCGMEAEHNPILDFGDLEVSGSEELLAAANNSIVLRAVARLGPLFLKRFLERYAPDVTLSATPFSMCSLCEEIVTNPAAREALNRHRGALSAYLVRAYEAEPA